MVLILACIVISARQGRAVEPTSQVTSQEDVGNATAANDGWEGSTQLAVDSLGDPLPYGAVARLGTRRLRHGAMIQVLAYSPDGKLLASGGRDWVARLWEPDSGKQLHAFEAVTHLSMPVTHLGWVLSVAFSPDGKVLATAGDYRDQMIRLWDVRTGKHLRTIEGHRGHVTSVAFSPNGKMLASGGADETIRFWNWETGRETRQLRGHTGRINCICFAPDGKRLASGGADRAVRLWDVLTGRVVQPLPALDGEVNAIAFTRDGKVVALGGNAPAIKLADPVSGAEIRRLNGFSGLVFSLAFSPDGKTLAAGCGTNVPRQWLSSGSGEVCTWDVATGKMRGPPSVQPSQIRAVTFSPDGRVLAMAGEDRVILRRDVLAARDMPVPGHRSYVSAVAFLPHSNTLMSAGFEGSLLQWELINGRGLPSKEPHVFASGKQAALTLAVSADGRHVAAGCDDGLLRVWEVRGGKLLHALAAHKGPIYQIAFAAQGTRLASGGQDGTVRLWDVATGQEVKQFLGHQGAVRSVAFSPDGRHLASGGDDRLVRLWDADTAKMQPLAGHGASVTQVAFLPSGKALASTSSDDCRTILWDVPTAMPRREFDVPKQHPGFKTMALSSDGRLIAISRDYDRLIKVFDVLTGVLTGQFHRQDGWIRTLAFSPDGKFLVSGSEDTTILVWSLASLQRPRPFSSDLDANDLESRWADLADTDAARGYMSLSVLVSVPRQSVAFLTNRLKAVAPVDSGHIERLVKDLDSERFTVRDQASKELEKQGELAEPALRKLLADSATLEAQRRAQRLLDKLTITSDRLQALRAIEALEYMGTPAAQALLDTLSRGAREAQVTRDAEAALKRLKRQLP
jgi:WD40 repeat protein